MKNVFIKLSVLIVILFLLTTCSKENEPEIRYNLEVVSIPNGGGTVNPSKGSYLTGVDVSLLGIPSSEYIFKEWTGALTGVTNPITITMNTNKTITGVFVKKTHPLNITIEGEGTVTEEIILQKTDSYDHGTAVQLTPVPSEGWEFVEWSGDLTGDENPVNVTVTNSINITVKFSVLKAFRDYNENSYNLRHTPLWIDHYSIPKQNNISTQQNGYYKWYDVGGNIADFNNDGYYDILFAPNGNDNTEIRLPIEIYLNKGDNETFTIAPTAMISNNVGLITARKTIIGDFNSDGKPDVFFADHGIHNGFPGGIPALLLSNGDRYNFELTNLPRGFYHATTSGDIDNDGDLDIYIPTIGTSKMDATYSFLINDGSGNFVIQNNIFQSDRASVSSELYDINNDGFLDLITGSNHVKIYYGDGVNFRSESSVQLHDDDDEWEAYDYGFHDIDNDGYDDIIVMFSDANGFKIRIFKQNLDNNFEEKTNDYIENSIRQNHSLVWIRVQDIDNNGFVDIIENDKGHFNSEEYSWSDVSGNTPARWEWNGNKFIKITP
jgi:hypothetical protein